MFVETNARSLLKTISWRVIATVVMALIVYFFTSKLSLALFVGCSEMIIKLFVYFFHERLWNRIHFGRHECAPAVIWFTGLPGSGKSTLALEVIRRLESKKLKTEHLDGDDLRKILPHVGFSMEERERHVRAVGLVASRLERHGVFVVVSLVSPYEASRAFSRRLCRNFIEVHLSTPIEVCEKRDPKGMYAQARSGKIKNFTGVNDPYECPLNPELQIDTSRVSIDEAVGMIMERVERGMKSSLALKKQEMVYSADAAPMTNGERGSTSPHLTPYESDRDFRECNPEL